MSIIDRLVGWFVDKNMSKSYGSVFVQFLKQANSSTVVYAIYFAPNDLERF